MTSHQQESWYGKNNIEKAMQDAALEPRCQREYGREYGGFGIKEFVNAKAITLPAVNDD